MGSFGGLTKIERLFIAGPVGRLEALMELDERANPKLTALVCHPHPVYGGTMHNKVAFRAAKAAHALGIPTLRFNFRGAGQSDGVFAEGVGERDDARSALDYLAKRFPAKPVCSMGFSFGAWVGLDVGASDPRVVALVGLGLPVASTDFNFLRGVRKPKLIVQGANDQYAPSAKIESLFASLDEPKRIHWVRGAKHFFEGKLDEVQDTIRQFLEEIATSLVAGGK